MIKWFVDGSNDEIIIDNIQYDTPDLVTATLFGRWTASHDCELYSIYCPGLFNDTAWKNRVDKMAVELVFSFPWNPFPMKMFLKWLATEFDKRDQEKALFR